ncbi:MAG: hypothetical protein AAF927_01680 [Bacteroidota bacterium]
MSNPSDIVSLLPEGFVDSLNDNQKVIEVEQPAPEAEKDEEGLYDELANEDDLEGKPWFIDGAEGVGDGLEGLEEEEIDNLGTAFADFCHLGKDMLESVYDTAFAHACKSEFGKEKKLEIIVLTYADESLGLTPKGIDESLNQWIKYDAQFSSINKIELVQTAMTFKRLKKKYQVRPMQEYQKDGIERYAKGSIRKLLSTSPDPLVMLVIYLVLTFGMDAWRIGKIEYDKYQESKKEAA